jgi:hypothetical protein
MISIILVSLVYMLGSLLANDKMKGWAKLELVEVVYSAVIITIGLSAIVTADQVVQGSLHVSNLGGGSGSPTYTFVPVVINGAKEYRGTDICDPNSILVSSPRSVYSNISSCHMKLGIYFMRELYDETKAFAYDTYLSYIETSMKAEFTINIEFVFEKAGFFTFTPWKGFYYMGNKIKEMLFDWSIKLMMLTKFQEVILNFIATALFPVLFVMGASLRAFPFTRRLGGLLLALSIALYFVYPAFYAFGALVMINIKNQARAEWVANTAANPHQNPDPPIANVMYTAGEIQTIGGSGRVSVDSLHNQLETYEGMSTEDYLRMMEGRGTGGVVPNIDLTSNAHASATDAQRQAALTNARRVTDNWFIDASRRSRFDTYISTVWVRNGEVDVMSRVTFWSMFFSMLGVLSTIAATRSLSGLFGGDAEIAGLTRLI